ncbi:MAG: DNA-binding response regulator [Verrucomicrobia bacterium]|nr:MAG: DNA-binding response regulator [Verrucomicrobiota bacterium]PYM07228.1 MAG: DNA-binding response regulator [Verrucomicrobiota bacterium]
MKTLRILLADDHKVVRQGTRALLSTVPEWEIVGEADNGRDAVSLTSELKPDIVILDIGMPELNGLDATRQIKKKLPDTEVLIFTGQETEELVHDVFDSGARSYIMKTDAADHLIDALKALSEHKHFFTSRISEIVFARYIQGKKTVEGAPEKSRITDREREIVQLLAEGKSSKEIATILGISVRTVETHRAAIMKKLGLKSFSELIRYAVRNKIIEA